MGSEALETLEISYDPRVCTGAVFLQLSKDHKLAAPKKDVTSTCLGSPVWPLCVCVDACTATSISCTYFSRFQLPIVKSSPKVDTLPSDDM